MIMPKGRVNYQEVYDLYQLCSETYAKLKTRKIMFSEKDFERLWFLYKTEGEPKGVSINSFCISNNIPYTAFYDWFKKTQKKIVPVEVEGISEELIQAGNKGNHSIFRLDTHRNLTYLCAVTFKNNDYGKRESKLSGGI